MKRKRPVASASAPSSLRLGRHSALWKGVAAPPCRDRLELQSRPSPTSGCLQRPGRDRSNTVPLPAGDGLASRDGSRGLRRRPVVRRDRGRARRCVPDPPRAITEGRLRRHLETCSGVPGICATLPARILPGARADLYYLGFDHERARFASFAIEQRRHTVAGRFFGNVAGWDWDWSCPANWAPSRSRSLGPRAFRPIRTIASIPADGRFAPDVDFSDVSAVYRFQAA